MADHGTLGSNDRLRSPLVRFLLGHRPTLDAEAPPFCIHSDNLVPDVAYAYEGEAWDCQPWRIRLARTRRPAPMGDGRKAKGLAWARSPRRAMAEVPGIDGLLILLSLGCRW